MAMFFGIVGMLGVPCCLVWLIVNAVRWDSKKPPLIGMLLCVILFFAGVAIYEPENKNSESENLRQQSEQTEDMKADDPDSKDATSSGKAGIEESDFESEGDTSIKTGDYELPSGVKLHFYDSVYNDATGKWRRAGTTSALPPADFAIEYYEKMFSSDDEIHSVWNATLKTTTKISVSGNILFVDTFEYVDGEEQDAKKMFSGRLLDSQIIDLKTNKPLEETEPEQELQVVDSVEKAESNLAGKQPRTSASQPMDTEPQDIIASKPTPVPEPAPDPVVTPEPKPGPAPEPPAAKPQPVEAEQKISGGKPNGSSSGSYDNNFAAGKVLITTASDNNKDPVYHTKNCRAAKKISQNDAYWFESEQAAIDDGRRLCGYCAKK